jgi:YesN/AraC family two-component response regulator
LSELLLTVCSTEAVDWDAHELLAREARDNINPSYLYQCLYHDCITLNACYTANHGKLKYQVQEYLDAHYMEPICLDSVADYFGITAVYLSSWFKKNLSINFSVYLTSLRMEKAKEYLTQNPGLKIAKLAQMVGLTNISTFNRQFKNYTGISPDQYRKRTGIDGI